MLEHRPGMCSTAQPSCMAAYRHEALERSQASKQHGRRHPVIEHGCIATLPCCLFACTHQPATSSVRVFICADAIVSASHCTNCTFLSSAIAL